MPPTVKPAGATFGRDKAPMIFGWIFAAHQLGGAGCGRAQQQHPHG